MSNPSAPGDRFAAVPEVWEERQRDFEVTARAVYIQLLLSMHLKTGIVRLSLRALAERTGLSKGRVERGLRRLVEGGIVRYVKGSNQHDVSTIEVLLRRSAVPPARRRAVPPVERQRDSDTGCQDGVSCEWDSHGTARPTSAAESPSRGLDVDEESADAAPSGCPSGPSGAPEGEYWRAQTRELFGLPPAHPNVPCHPGD